MKKHSGSINNSSYLENNIFRNYFSPPKKKSGFILHLSIYIKEKNNLFSLPYSHINYVLALLQI